MDLSEVVGSIVTVAVAAASAYKASRGAAGSVSKQVKDSIEGPDHKLDEVIEKQKSEGLRIDALGERVESLAIAFKIHDKAQLDRDVAVTRMLDTVQNIAKAQLLTAKDQNEVMKTQKVWLDENRVLITSVKKGNKNEG